MKLITDIDHFNLEMPDNSTLSEIMHQLGWRGKNRVRLIAHRHDTKTYHVSGSKLDFTVTTDMYNYTK
jgi:hypothetical protein